MSEPIDAFDMLDACDKLFKETSEQFRRAFYVAQKDDDRRRRAIGDFIEIENRLKNSMRHILDVAEHGISPPEELLRTISRMCRKELGGQL